MKWFAPFGWFILTLVRIGVSFALIGQSAALVLVAPFGNLYERFFIKIAEENHSIALLLKKELAAEERAKKRKAKR